MKALKIIGVILLVLFLGLIIVNTIAGTTYDVNRTTEINAPASVIFEQISDLKNWEAWGPWSQNDNTMKMIFEGPTTGVGANYSWTSENSGNGKLTILTLEQDKGMTSELDFGEMGKSNGYWNLEEKDGVTHVTWGFKGEMPWLMAFYTLTMDGMVGPMFEQGLGNIKSIAEENFANQPKIEIVETTVEAMPTYRISAEMTFEEIMKSDTYANYFGELSAFLGEENMGTMLGNPFVIFHVWDEENQITKVEFCFPASAELEETDRVKKGMSHGGMAIMASKNGDYNTKAEHEALYAYTEANGLTMVGSPWEVYGDPDTQGTYVEVYYPVMKSEEVSE